MAETVQCPKCGFEQEESVECMRCGIIFSRMHQPAVPPVSEESLNPDRDSTRPSAGRFRRYYRIFRWLSLIVIAVAAALILNDSPPPNVETTPYATAQAEVKFREFRSKIQQGRQGELELDQSELNSWLETSLAIQDTTDSASSGLQEREPDIDAMLQRYEIDEESLEKAKSSIRDLQVELLEDTLRLYALFDTYGIDLSLEIEGRLRVRDGYLRLEPIRGRLGSLPLPSATLHKAVDKLFESPDNREKFRLPPGIRDIEIVGGQLVVTTREISPKFL